MLTGDERAIAEQQARLQAEAIAERQRVIAEQQRAIADQATIDRQQAEAIAAQERQQKEKLANYLRSIGVDPDAV